MDDNKIEYIHKNENIYEEFDGNRIRKFPERVKIIISNPRKIEGYGYPYIEIDVEFEILDKEEE
jgi:hypothetical protein